MSDDDCCADEGREADIEERHVDGCMRDYGVPFDPYADDDDEEEGEE